MQAEYYKFSLPELFRNYRDLRALGIKAGFRKDIFKTCFFALFLGRYGGAAKTVESAGFKVKYCTVESFLYLFREIFLMQAYWFVTENRSPFIIDCGANIGMASLYFKALYPGAEILAFEPDPESFANLRDNVSRGGLKGIVLRNEALLKEGGTVDLYYSGESPGSLCASTLPARLPGPSKKVSAARLSGYISREVDFLKIDIEGAETDVIAELASSGKLGFIKRMAVEYHHHIDARVDSLSVILGVLEEAGFGYQLSGGPQKPFKEARFQDILIYAYNKKLVARPEKSS
ncbi:MAG: hypothetical protein A2270_02785 [Elusimicrobia bacterium RIFOXYA12_FULL_51_18]|nr:MAG: hypothetical protein A2270_02785 [Elusimicrobia bacterium RIFOXYA12_FULL_51_18]OGS28326.1 MAG: hypothetical protein A2218_00035 [Elusimicrobia bacterium RIFOXYA2_FULL_53_38]